SQLVEVDTGADVDAELPTAGVDVDGVVLVALDVDAETGRWLGEPIDFLLERDDLLAGLPQRGRQPLVLTGDVGEHRLGLGEPLFELSRLSWLFGEPTSQSRDLFLEVADLVGELRWRASRAPILVCGHVPHLPSPSSRSST